MTLAISRSLLKGATRGREKNGDQVQEGLEGGTRRIQVTDAGRKEKSYSNVVKKREKTVAAICNSILLTSVFSFDGH